VRPLLVGDINPYSDDPAHALLPWPANSAGSRLARLLVLSDRQYLSAFDRMNLRLPHEQWGNPAILGRVQEVNARLCQKVLLGRDVQRAFGFTRSRPLERFGTFLLVPHPSGRCLYWNDPSNAIALRQLINELVGRKLCTS